MQEQIKAYFASHRDEMVADIKTLVNIPSVNAPATEDRPFGEEPYRALLSAKAMADKYGFTKIENVDNYVLKIEYGEGEAELGILAHLDVVPAGGGWTVCEPFECVEKDGIIYGRGTSDDKGPAVAALYALRCVKELNIPLKKSVQLILGCGEETGSRDIAYYLTKYDMPKAVFSPDGEYPLTNTEKGRVRVDFTANVEQNDATAKVIYAKGGIAVNAVPAEATALVTGVTAQQIIGLVNKIESLTKATFRLNDTINGLEIMCFGVNAHASTPQMGINAVLALLMLLNQLPLSPNVQDKLFAILSLMPFGDTEGKALGIDAQDEVSGKLTITLDILEWKDDQILTQLDCRYPICCNKDEIASVIEKKALAAGLDFVYVSGENPHHTEKNTPLVKSLLKIYESYTGLEGACMYTGGGTYVHDIAGGVSFGCVFPGKDTHMHGPNEYVEIDDLLISGAMFAQAIIDLCGESVNLRKND